MADNNSDAIAQCVEGQQEPLTKFTLFPELPLELRLKIFKRALPIGPRGFRILKVAIDTIISVTNSKTITNRAFDNHESRVECTSHLTFSLMHHRHDTHITDLGLLSACSESRDVYLRHFTQSMRAGENGLIRFAKEDIIYIANIWDCFRSAYFHKILRPGKGFEGIPGQRLALPISWFFDEWLKCWVLTDLPAEGVMLEVITNCPILKEIGVITGEWEMMVEGAINEEWLARRDPKEMAVIPLQGQALDWADTIRRDWEELEELRGRKLPEVCVWGKDGERIKRAKKEARASLEK